MRTRDDKQHNNERENMTKYRTTIGDYDNILSTKEFSTLDNAQIQADKWQHLLGREHAELDNVICLITVANWDEIAEMWKIVGETEF
jgi:hypothetical protein